jgi:putative ribosome biogenesis GTPase RsgA
VGRAEPAEGVLQRAARGEPAVVIVAGEAGVGKSQLVAELQAAQAPAVDSGHTRARLSRNEPPVATIPWLMVQAHGGREIIP